jgi:hypothetical protein
MSSDTPNHDDGGNDLPSQPSIQAAHLRLARNELTLRQGASPMKKHLLFLLLAMSMPLFAQNTTYTTSQDGCGGKAFQYCTLPVTDGTGTTEQIIIDNSFNGGSLTIQQGTYPDQTTIVAAQGTYNGFVGNPDGTRNAFYGVAAFESNDGTVSGSFQFYSYYASTCSGRGCGGTLGWHFKVLMGSTVTAQ